MHTDGEAGIYTTYTFENPKVTIIIQKVDVPHLFTNNNAINFLIKELYFAGDLSSANKVIFYKGASYEDRYVSGVQIYKDSYMIANIAANFGTLNEALDICDNGIINYNNGYIIVNWGSLNQGITTFTVDGGLFNNNILDYSPSIKALLLNNNISAKYAEIVPILKGEVAVVSSFTSAHTQLGIHLKKRNNL